MKRETDGYQSQQKDTMVKEPAAVYPAGKMQGDYTIEDYYQLPDEHRVELIDGVFYDMAAPSLVHQEMIGAVFSVFYQYIKENKKPCRVYLSPVDVQLCRDNRTMVQPDMIVVCEQEKRKHFGIFGAPDFVLEVLSDSTRNKDMTIKLRKYREAGVREYWMIDLKKSMLIVYDFSVGEVPRFYSMTQKVPVSITGGELMVDFPIILESIEEEV